MTGSVLGDDELHAVVEAATLAPSVHNTQPWRFTWDGQSLSVIEDPSRGLPVLDPTGRERVLSCGAAALNARLTLHNLGHGARVRVLPEPSDPALLVRLEVVPDEGAASDADAALALAIPRRATDRGVYDERVVPSEAIQRLAAAAELEGGWLRPVERQDEKVALSVLLSHADEIERSDPAYQAELARWRTHERAAEGVPDAAVGDSPASARGSDYVLRDFRLGEPAGQPVTHEPPHAEHPLAVVVGTEHDERSDWVTAGMALGRVLLQATTEGLAASPMTQVVEIDHLRLRLRQELGLVGMPQVVLRVGYGHEGVATRRRPVEQVLQVV